MVYFLVGYVLLRYIALVFKECDSILAKTKKIVDYVLLEKGLREKHAM